MDIRRLIEKIKLSATSDSWTRSFLRVKYFYPQEVQKSNSEVKLLLLNVIIPSGHLSFVFDEYEKLVLLKNKLRVQFFINKGRFYARINELTLSVTSSEEVFVINEIFTKEVYSFKCGGEYNVIDVGMNVAFGSLYFASLDFVKKVFSYEPFAKTFEQGMVNLRLNPEYALKIMASQFGLGDRSEEFLVNYDYANKAQIGIHGTSLVKGKIFSPQKERMIIKEAAPELLKIINDNPSNYLLKLDCEGAEYSIMRNLEQSGLISRLSAVIVEWHEEGPNEIVSILLRNNFWIFNQSEAHKAVGMIYAGKRA